MEILNLVRRTWVYSFIVVTPANFAGVILLATVIRLHTVEN